MRDFVVGNLYFIVRYADQDCLLIDPRAVVFTGKNLNDNKETHGNRGMDTWYFQDPTSYCLYGAWDYSEPFDKEVNAEVLAACDIRTALFELPEGALHEVVDCEGLARILFECARRRAKADRST